MTPPDLTASREGEGDSSSRDHAQSTCAATRDPVARAATEVRPEPCEYCDAGWTEGAPDPTPNGPYFPSQRCTACDGRGWVEIEYRPVSFDDLVEMSEGESDDVYSAFAYRGGNP